MPADRAEEARARMLDLFPDGFEELNRGTEVELASYADAELDPIVRDAFSRVESTAVRAGWEDEWKRFHRGVRIGPLWVGPPWEAADAEGIAVVVDPGRAFGTGAHPTTRLCLELVSELPRGSLLDLGCGSGVVAIAAAKLGFAPVVALDVDPAAVEATKRNARANRARLAATVADVLADPLPAADVAVANIAREPVERVAARVAARLLLASGYLARDRVAPPGWTLVERREREGWAAEVLERSAGVGG